MGKMSAVCETDPIAEYSAECEHGVDREAVMRFAAELPPLPHTAAKLLQLLNDPNVETEALAEAASGDAAIAFAILKLSNSAMFARQRQVATVREGIGFIGLTNLRHVVLAQALTRLNRQPGPFDRLVRDNAVATGLLARAVARRLIRRDADALFLTGVLHRLGQFAFAAHPQTRATCLRVLARIRAHREDYVTAEKAELGFSHPIIGALVANRWNLPGDLSVVLLHYHSPFEGLDTDADFKVGLIKFCDAAAHTANIGSPEGYPDQRDLLLKLGKQLKLFGDKPKAELDALLTDFRASFEREAQIWS
jgi:HD-like signal output (HDOD) protein